MIYYRMTPAGPGPGRAVRGNLKTSKSRFQPPCRSDCRRPPGPASGPGRASPRLLLKGAGPGPGPGRLAFAGVAPEAQAVTVSESVTVDTTT
jgi:hypothetical protein